MERLASGDSRTERTTNSPCHSIRCYLARLGRRQICLPDHALHAVWRHIAVSSQLRRGCQAQQCRQMKMTVLYVSRRQYSEVASRRGHEAPLPQEAWRGFPQRGEVHLAAKSPSSTIISGKIVGSSSKTVRHICPVSRSDLELALAPGEPGLRAAAAQLRAATTQPPAWNEHRKPVPPKIPPAGSFLEPTKAERSATYAVEVLGHFCCIPQYLNGI